MRNKQIYCTNAQVDEVWNNLYNNVPISKICKKNPTYQTHLTNQANNHNYHGWARLRLVPLFSSGIVQRAKRERAWKSPLARNAPRRVSHCFFGESFNIRLSSNSCWYWSLALHLFKSWIVPRINRHQEDKYSGNPMHYPVDSALHL